ncbi:zinc-binding dehydrogenase [Hoeflea sp. WL0058]|uniref:Zinc-binding dehydrogenase n=1 Tax=Flavimaribacter sediminis TaxID=2865987 RepID=A0AAE2ZTS2_9HYPH|nr:zinc-binding dehydrogenase [Flavimaribacter sediminis]MBW8639482.1 zinc-binding dehydrogenase [Flavimaribacter sediminis]
MKGLLLRQGGFAEKAESLDTHIDRPGDYLELAEFPKPKLAPGQVLIKMRRATINPSDIAFVRGVYGQPRVEGKPAGFEGVGVVVDAGPGLYGNFLKGRRVGFYVTPDGSGTWAEYAVTQAMLALPLKKGVADRDAAGLVVNPVTAVAMLDLVKPGEAFVFSAAASQLGKLMAGLAKDQGKRMIALVRREAPVAMLKDLGAAYALNETDADYEADLASILEKEKPVVFLDAVAGGRSAQTHTMMGDRARWVIYGRLDDSPAEILDPGAMIFKRKMIEGFWTTDWAAKTSFVQKMRVFNEVQNRFRDGRWKTDVSVELPLEQAIDRLPQALAQPDGKVQIVMPDG